MRVYSTSIRQQKLCYFTVINLDLNFVSQVPDSAAKATGMCKG